MKRVIAILLIPIIWACESSNEDSRTQIDVPNIEVHIDSVEIQKKGALLLVNEQPFSGFLIESNDDEFFTTKTGYFNGKKEGRSEQFYENGNLKEVRYYSANRKEGLHQGWWPNGTKKFDINFINGLTEGESKEWFEDGSPYKIFHYQAGQEVGSQKMWEVTGNIRANYVVKNGHRYGLIGLKSCKSVENEDGSLAALAY